MTDWLPNFFFWVWMHFAALFKSPESIYWKVLFPPIFYGFHGWLATWMAVAALFRPYNPIYVFRYQLPLTPGIFPKRRSKLSQPVAGTVTATLLTAADIKAKAETLVPE